MRALLLTGIAAGAVISGVVAASAADVRAPVRVVAPAPVPDWSGHYFGLSLGWGQAHGRLNDTVPTYSSAAGFQNTSAANAFLLGGKLGYNFGSGFGRSMVLGVEADVTAVFGEDARCTDATCAIASNGGTPALAYNLGGLGSISGRIGWANPRSMFYVLAGVAVGQVTTKEWGGVSSVGDWTTHLFTGWTAGAGVDVMAAPRVSWGIEGRYYDLGTKTLTSPVGTVVAWHPIEWTLTVGTKYHF